MVIFLDHALGAINRILPHVSVSSWTEGEWAKTRVVWTSITRTEIRVVLGLGESRETGRSLTATIKRRNIDGATGGTLDNREKDICAGIAQRTSEVLSVPSQFHNESMLKAVRDAFDEYVVAQHIESHHNLPALSVDSILEMLHTLSEQSYENKALTFGCIIDTTEQTGDDISRFPSDFLTAKKFKALSDGFHTAYRVSKHGVLLDFVDLDRFEKKPLTSKHHYPAWAEPIARASRDGRCGLALSRQGDILIFEEGSLRLTYRFGRWQYWNHSHLIHMLRDQTKAQSVKPVILARVVGAIYRTALDVSFRRSGGLFVILKNRQNLNKVVRPGDEIASPGRSGADKAFDVVVREHPIQTLPRPVASELAALDGALVFSNAGQLLAYGAVLRPKKAGKLNGSEGSRTKAAIGASNYGLAVKVSSDGDITIYRQGTSFIKV